MLPHLFRIRDSAVRKQLLQHLFGIQRNTVVYYNAAQRNRVCANPVPFSAPERMFNLNVFQSVNLNPVSAFSRFDQTICVRLPAKLVSQGQLHRRKSHGQGVHARAHLVLSLLQVRFRASPLSPAPPILSLTCIVMACTGPQIERDFRRARPILRRWSAGAKRF